MKYPPKIVSGISIVVLLTITTLLTTIQLQLTRADSSTFQSADKFLEKCTKAQDSLNEKKKIQAEDQFKRHAGPGSNALCP